MPRSALNGCFVRGIKSFAMAAFLPSFLWAQGPAIVNVPVATACPRCSIEWRLRATVGILADTEFEGRGPLQVYSGSGQTLVFAPRSGRPALALLDSTGRAIRSVGGVGDGPGEFRLPTVLARFRGDSIWVYDRGQRRVSVLSADYHFVRSFSMPYSVDGLVGRDDGTMFMNGIVPTREKAGLPIHAISPEGEILRSFGDQEPEFRARNPNFQRRLLVWAKGRLISLPALREYRIEEWSAEGTLLRVLLRKASWFEKYDSLTGLTPSEPPKPNIAGAWVDQVGLLWVFVRVPSTEWREQVGEARIVERRRVHLVRNTELLEDTIVDVFDLTSAQLIASNRFPRRVSAVLTDGTVAVIRTLDSGNVTTELWNAALVRP